MIDSILIANFPWPPTVNGLYSNAGTYRTKRVKSREYRQYLSNCIVYKQKYRQDIEKMKLAVKEWVGEKRVLHLNIDLVGYRSNFWTKAGVPKRIDSDNRIKALQDALSSILEFDDKFIFKNTIEKTESEYINLIANITIEPIEPKISEYDKIYNARCIC